LDAGRPAIIAVPNLDYAARYWLHGPDRGMALDMLFGHQGEAGETHLTGWSPASFRAELEAAGFTIVTLSVIFETPDTAEGSYSHAMETIRAEVAKPWPGEVAA